MEWVRFGCVHSDLGQSSCLLAGNEEGDAACCPQHDLLVPCGGLRQFGINAVHDINCNWKTGSCGCLFSLDASQDLLQL